MNDQPKESRLDQIRKSLENKEMEKSDPEAKKVFNLAANLSKRMPEPLETPADLIKEQIEKGKLLVGKGKLEVQAAQPEPGQLPALPDLPPIVIDGHEFKRTNIPALDAMTTMMYIFAELSIDNPRIADILNQVKFQFPDNAGNLIYPKVKTPETKEKPSDDRPSE